MKLIPVLIVAMFVFSGMALLTQTNNVSATPTTPTTYLNDNFEGPFNTGAYFRVFSPFTCTLSTSQAFSPSHSLELSGFGDGLYNQLPIIGTPDITVSFEVYLTSYPSTFDNQNWLIYSSGNTSVNFDLILGPNGNITTFDTSTNWGNATGLSLSLNSWHNVSLNIFDHCTQIKLSVDGVSSAIMYGQPASYNDYYHMWVQCNGGTDVRYYDDFMITDMIPITPPAITNITDARIPNQWVLVQEERPGFPSVYTPSPFVTWTGTEYGQQQIVSTDSILATNSIFKPGYDFRVTMRLQLEIYDGDKLVYVYDWPLRLSNTNPNWIYQFSNGNASLADAETIATGHTNEWINIHPESGHTYYFIYDMRLADLNGTSLPTTTFSAVITTQLPMNNQGTWINGLIWILILFTGPWLLNWFLPRYGFIGGMIIMAMALGIVEPSFYYVSIIILATVGIMIYGLSRGD